eukprot:gene4347-4600_t
MALDSGSIVSQFSLVCAEAWKVQFINTMMFIGCFLGAGLFGPLCDKLGRKLPLFISSGIIAISLFASAASPWLGGYWCLAVARLLTGFAAAGQSQCIVLLCLETTGATCRGLVQVGSLLFLPLGEFLLVAVASAHPNWQVVQNPAMLARSLVLFLTWFALYSAAYGVVLGSGALPGSIYVTFALMTTAEVTAMITAGSLVDRIGRHNIISLGLLLGGAACLACANSPDESAKAALAVLGKFGCSSELAGDAGTADERCVLHPAFTCITVSLGALGTYTSELFPTPLRATAMGTFNQAARCGSIAAPCLLMLGAMFQSRSALFLPYLTYGSVSVLAGLLVLLMPETLGAPMPEDMDDMAALQSVFSAKQEGCWATFACLFRTHAVLLVPEQHMPEVVRPGSATAANTCASVTKCHGADLLDEYSLVAQFSLVCSNAWKVQLVNSFLFVGGFIGSGLFGVLADSLGRRLPLFLATTIVAASTFISLASPNYWFYAVTRAVTGMGAAVGEFLLVALGYALPNWRHLALAAACINVGALLLFPVVPESARWLLSKGRTAEATAILQKLSARNGSHMPMYYGISMGAGGLPGSIYVTFALGVVAEVVALCVAGPAVDRVGRHNVVSMGLLLGGGACLACALWSDPTAQVVLAAVGKFGCAGAESVIAIYTAELFPTCVRSTAMGIFNQAARCGSIAAPFLLMLGAQLNIRSAVFVPYMVFGCMSVFAGLMVLLLPETLGAHMPETMQVSSSGCLTETSALSSSIKHVVRGCPGQNAGLPG